MNNAADIRQADAGAFKFVGAMQALEHTEQFVRISHVKPDTVVANEHHRLLGRLAGTAGVNLGRVARACVLHGVAQQVDQHLAQHGRIAFDFWQAAVFPNDVAASNVLFQAVDCLLNELL